MCLSSGVPSFICDNFRGCGGGGGDVGAEMRVFWVLIFSDLSVNSEIQSDTMTQTSKTKIPLSFVSNGEFHCSSLLIRTQVIGGPI